jgi:hypothetical protein
MAARSATSNLLIFLVLIFTFPLWIGLGAGLFGLVVGIFGAAIGVMAGIFGALVAVIVLPFKLIFGWGHGGWWPHFHVNGILIAIVIVLTALLIRKSR